MPPPSCPSPRRCSKTSRRAPSDRPSWAGAFRTSRSTRKNPHVFYAGLATGGIVKTVNDGITFEPIFDKQPDAFHRRAGLAPSNPDVLWVGTGEANDRNSSGWGNGVYRSTDGGEHWQHLGLDTSRAINRDRRRSAQPGRGLRRRRGQPLGRRRRTRPLQNHRRRQDVDERPPSSRTPPRADRLRRRGARPGEPRHVLRRALRAAAHAVVLHLRPRGQRRRGRGRHLQEHATAGRPGKSSPRVCPREPVASAWPWPPAIRGWSWPSCRATPTAATISAISIRWPAACSARRTAANIGRARTTSTRARSTSARSASTPRTTSACTCSAWRCSPPTTAARPSARTSSRRSTPTATRSSSNPAARPRPARPSPRTRSKPPKPPVSARLLLGTDGGVYQSFQAGSQLEPPQPILLRPVLPGRDGRQPAVLPRGRRLAGQQQFRRSQRRPTRKDGIVNSDWMGLTGADGFYTASIPRTRKSCTPRRRRASSSASTCARARARTCIPPRRRVRRATGSTGTRRSSRAATTRGCSTMAGNRVFKLTDHGEHSAVISPDLTKDDPARQHRRGQRRGELRRRVLARRVARARRTCCGRARTTAASGSPRTRARSGPNSPTTSPHRRTASGYTASSPGRERPERGLRGFQRLPVGRRPPDDLPHRRSGQDVAIHCRRGAARRTRPRRSSARTPETRACCTAGTQAGLFASFDQGGHWVKIGGLPAVEVDDLQIQERAGDLVIATHGLSLYVLDDTRPLRELTTEVAAEPAHLFSVRPVEGAYRLPGFEDWNGKGNYHGANPAEGALFTVWVKEFTGDEIKLKVTNAAGQTVANLQGTRRARVEPAELGPAAHAGCSGKIRRRRPEEVGAHGRLHRRIKLRADQGQTDFPCDGRAGHRSPLGGRRRPVKG